MKLTGIFTATSAVIITKYIKIEIIKGGENGPRYKNEEVEEVQEEEVVETAEETTPEKSELDLANERADEFENKYLRALCGNAKHPTPCQ